MDLLANFAARHPSDRIRWCALRARAAAAPTLDARIAMFEEGARTDSLLVSAMARREALRIEAGRAWIDGAPLARRARPPPERPIKTMAASAAFCYKWPRWAVFWETANGHAQYPDRRRFWRQPPFPQSPSVVVRRARAPRGTATNGGRRRSMPPAPRDLDRCNEAISTSRASAVRRSSSRPTSIAAS